MFNDKELKEYRRLQRLWKNDMLSPQETKLFEAMYRDQIISNYGNYCKFIFPTYKFVKPHYELMETIDTAIQDSIENQRLNIVIGELPPQFGKEVANYHRIKTTNGWTTHGEIKVGDMVDNAHGGYSQVTGVFPQGEKELYRVTFEDGRYVDAGLPHLWKVINREFGGDGSKVIDTAEIMRLLKLPTYANRLYVPKYMPVQDDAPSELLLNPYLLGALLGDGSITGGTTFHNVDEFVINKVNIILSDYDCELQYRSRCCYGIRGRVNNDKSRESNHVRFILKELGLLGTTCVDKFIPEQYLNANYSQRIELLNGLMDTDGHATKNGGIEYSTVSKSLAEGVQYLVRSIGGNCKIKECYKTFDYKGDKRTSRLTYVLAIRHSDQTLIFSMPRHLERLQSKHRRSEAQLRIKSVEPIGKHEATCIMVDHPEHLQSDRMM